MKATRVTVAVVMMVTVGVGIVETATAYVWDGGAGAGFRFWNSAANWNPDGVPGPGDSAYIANGDTVFISLGDANPGTLSIDGTSGVMVGSNRSLSVGNLTVGHYGASLVCEGGEVAGSGGGELWNNGMVKSDGLGIQDACGVDLSNFESCHTNVEFADPRAGWFAENKGWVKLPNIELTSSGDVGYSWGEEVEDATLELVNSFRAEFTNLTVTGNEAFSCTLLADDLLADTPGTWKSVLGVWQFEEFGGLSGGSYDSVEMMFRYDDTKVADWNEDNEVNDEDEDLLRLAYYSDGWHDAAYIPPDTWNNRIWSYYTPQSSAFDYIWVVFAVPEPATIAWLALGSVVLLQKRRR